MFLGIDLGTGSVKALLLSESGQVLREHSEPYAVLSKASGWAESETADWWQATCKAVRQCTQGFEVKSIGLSGQMHGVVLCKADGSALRPAILWADTRSSTTLGYYAALTTSKKQILANPLAAGMMGPSLLWLKQYENDSYSSAEFALSPKDWLRFKLVGVAQSEPSDASATLLYDLANDGWADTIIADLGLRRELLAPLVASADICGHLSQDAAQSLGLKPVPVVAGGADAACSAYGAGLSQEGQAQINLGTAMQIFAIRDKAQIDPSLRTHLYRTVESNYYAMAAMQNSGIAFEWVRRLLGLSWPDMYTEAFEKTNSSRGLVFLPYLTGERTPHLNPFAQACWQGMRLEHERCHLLRAVFEGIAFALKDGLVALQETGLEFETLRLAGGGSLHPAWQQLLADILACPLEPVEQPSASAVGAARLAAVGLGQTVQNADISKAPILAKDTERYLEPYQNFRLTYQRLYPNS